MSDLLRDLQLLEAVPAANIEKMAADFLAHMPPERKSVAEKSLRAILGPYQDGSEIFNVDYQDNKDRLNRSFEIAFDAMDEKLSYHDRSKLGFGLSLYSIPSLLKKIEKHSKPGKNQFESPPELIEKFRQFFVAMLPISQALEALKKQIVKGKKPLSPEKQAAKAAQLAKKDVKTCGCCFRPIAVLPNGLIADHGYTLPHPGLKSSSCPGRKFRPLEVSDDGLKYMVKLYEEWVAGDLKALAEAPKKTEVVKPGWGKKVEIVKKGDPTWDIVFKQYVSNLEDTLRKDQDGLKSYSAKLAAWKPAPTEATAESLRSLTRALALVVEEPKAPTRPPAGHGPRGCGPGEQFYDKLGRCVPIAKDSQFPRHGARAKP